MGPVAQTVHVCLCREDGLVNEDVIARYKRYASGGADLVVVEAMTVHKLKSEPLLRVSDDSYLPGLRELARPVGARTRP